MKKLILRVLAAAIISISVLSVVPFTVAASETEVSRASFKYDFPSDAASVNVKLDGKRVLDGEAAII